MNVNTDLALLPLTQLTKTLIEACGSLAASALQEGKTLTADNLAKKNWSCEPLCSFCPCFPESADHLLSPCNFAEAVWHRLADQLRLPQALRGACDQGAMPWLEEFTRAGPSSEAKLRAGLLLTFWWGLWKERIRRIFQRKDLYHLQTVELFLDDHKASLTGILQLQ